MAVVGLAEVLVQPSFKGTQRTISQEFDGAASKAGQSAGTTMGSKLGGALKVGAVAAGGAVIAGLGLALTKGFSRLQAIENARAKLTGLGHSAKSVEKIMGNALASVKGTSFGLGEAATVAANAVASGVKPGKDLERTLKLVGDAATVAGVPIEQMGAIFNKAAASNKVQMDIINQLHDAGVPALALLAKEMGVTAEEASKMASAGKIDFKTFSDAMEAGMGGAAQESGKTLQGAFANTMAAVGRIGANLLTGVYPKIQEFFSTAIGWLEPMEAGAKVAGEAIGKFITDTLLPALQNTAKWIGENKTLIGFLATAVGGAAAGFLVWKAAMGAWTIATNIAATAMGVFNAVMNANPIMKIITLIGLLVGAFVWLYNNNETARKIMDAAWKGIQNAVKFAWEKVIKPIVTAVVWYLQNIFAPAWTWIFKNIIKPVWDSIMSVIKIAWAVIETIFLAIKWTIDNVLAPIFNKLYKTYIKPVWDLIASVIKSVWDKKIKPVFEALGAFIEKKVAPGFQKGVNAIRDIWNAIMDIAKKPINFVIDTVYNNGLRKALNKVREIVGGSPLQPLPLVGAPSGNKGVATKGGPMRAFAKGGFAAPGWALVGEEGPELVNFSNPGRVYTAAQSREMLATDVDKRSSLPMGAGLWDGIKNAVGGAVSWARGSLANAAGMILNPIKDGIAGTLSGMFGNTVLGDVSSGLVRSTVDSVLKWIRGKDAADSAAGLATYDGPLGKFTRPSRGPFTSMFGHRPAFGDFHTGVDIGGGGPTYAALNGVVSRIGYDPIGGNWIRLNHGNGFGTYYGHNPANGIMVKQGQKVKAGQRIGTQGMTGLATGVHLHFQTEKNGQPVNPMAYLHDNGGVLRPGLSTILNNTGKPEAILNQRQWQDIHKLAKRGTGGAGTQVTIKGNVGWMPDEVARQIETQKRRSQTVAGMNGVVFA